jgi:hypothetical protein
MRIAGWIFAWERRDVSSMASSGSIKAAAKRPALKRQLGKLNSDRKVDMGRNETSHWKACSDFHLINKVD